MEKLPASLTLADWLFEPLSRTFLRETSLSLASVAPFPGTKIPFGELIPHRPVTNLELSPLWIRHDDSYERFLRNINFRRGGIPRLVQVGQKCTLRPRFLTRPLCETLNYRDCVKKKKKKKRSERGKNRSLIEGRKWRWRERERVVIPFLFVHSFQGTRY